MGRFHPSGSSDPRPSPRITLGGPSSKAVGPSREMREA